MCVSKRFCVRVTHRELDHDVPLLEQELLVTVRLHLLLLHRRPLLLQLRHLCD